MGRPFWLQCRQLINSMRLRPADGSGAQSARVLPAGGSGGLAGAGAAAAAGPAPEGPKSAPAGGLKSVSRTYVPVRTLPLIFAQRKRHLQQQKSKAQHAAPYQRRAGEGLLALPEDVLVSACGQPLEEVGWPARCCVTAQRQLTCLLPLRHYLCAGFTTPPAAAPLELAHAFGFTPPCFPSSLACAAAQGGVLPDARRAEAAVPSLPGAAHNGGCALRWRWGQPGGLCALSVVSKFFPSHLPTLLFPRQSPLSAAAQRCGVPLQLQHAQPPGGGPAAAGAGGAPAPPGAHERAPGHQPPVPWSTRSLRVSRRPACLANPSAPQPGSAARQPVRQCSAAQRSHPDPGCRPSLTTTPSCPPFAGAATAAARRAALPRGRSTLQTPRRPQDWPPTHEAR